MSTPCLAEITENILMKTKSITKDKVSVITLGCSKNTVDSEVLMAHLQHGGYDVIHDKWKKGRNIVVVNTCGFIDKAKEESINTIMEYAEAKNQGKIEKLHSVSKLILIAIIILQFSQLH